MSYRKYHETAEQAASRFSRERRAAADLFPALCAVFRDFDGKVYNKRLDAAISERVGHIYVTKRTGNAIDIYFYTDSGTMLTLAYVKIPENKRINAADFIQAAETCRNTYLKEAAHMDEVAPTMQTRIQQIDYIKALLEKTLADLSYEEKDIFDLNFHVKKW